MSLRPKPKIILQWGTLSSSSSIQIITSIILRKMNRSYLLIFSQDWNIWKRSYVKNKMSMTISPIKNNAPIIRWIHSHPIFFFRLVRSTSLAGLAWSGLHWTTLSWSSSSCLWIWTLVIFSNSRGRFFVVGFIASRVNQQLSSLTMRFPEKSSRFIFPTKVFGIQAQMCSQINLIF